MSLKLSQKTLENLGKAEDYLRAYTQTKDLQVKQDMLNFMRDTLKDCIDGIFDDMTIDNFDVVMETIVGKITMIKYAAKAAL